MVLKDYVIAITGLCAWCGFWTVESKNVLHLFIT